MGFAPFLQNPFRGQASRQGHHRQTGSRVGAAADKVEIAVPVVPVVWPQVAYLQFFLTFVLAYATMRAMLPG